MTLYVDQTPIYLTGGSICNVIVVSPNCLSRRRGSQGDIEHQRYKLGITAADMSLILKL